MSYKNKLINIKNFVFDIDGVFTNGIIYVDSVGKETREFNSKDGLVVKYAVRCGYNIGVISGAGNDGILKRLKKLDIKNIYLSSKNKCDDLNIFLKTNKLNPDQTLYMGDDLSDLDAMKMVSLKTCPNDAVSEVRNIADYVSPKKGGFGCVRDVLEQVLKIQDNWDLKSYDQNI